MSSLFEVSMKQIVFFLLFAASALFAKGVEDASGYHINSAPQATWAKAVLEAIPWTGRERVLDVGCGDGKTTAWIAEAFSDGQVTGVDISESMVQFASSRYARSNLAFCQGDASALPFEEEFDVAVSFSTLHWVLDQEAALASIYKALTPGGRAYILTHGKAPMNLSRLSENLIYSEKWASYFSDYTPQRVYYTPEEYAILLQSAGFSRVELTAERAQTIYPDRNALISFVRPLLNFIRHLPEELKEEFLGEVVDRIIALAGPTEDGSIVFEVLNLNVFAEK